MGAFRLAGSSLQAVPAPSGARTAGACLLWSAPARRQARVAAAVESRALGGAPNAQICLASTKQWHQQCRDTCSLRCRPLRLPAACVLKARRVRVGHVEEALFSYARHRRDAPRRCIQRFVGASAAGDEPEGHRPSILTAVGMQVCQRDASSGWQHVRVRPMRWTRSHWTEHDGRCVFPHRV
jgi:hypothetical protein